MARERRNQETSSRLTLGRTAVRAAGRTSPIAGADLALVPQGNCAPQQVWDSSAVSARGVRSSSGIHALEVSRACELIEVARCSSGRSPMLTASTIAHVMTAPQLPPPLTPDERRLRWFALAYALVLVLAAAVVAKVLWNKEDPHFAYVPVYILFWGFAGGIVSVLMRAAYRHGFDADDFDLGTWMLSSRSSRCRQRRSSISSR
jgi:hypothetical protein